VPTLFIAHLRARKHLHDGRGRGLSDRAWFMRMSGDASLRRALEGRPFGFPRHLSWKIGRYLYCRGNRYCVLPRSARGETCARGRGQAPSYPPVRHYDRSAHRGLKRARAAPKVKPGPEAAGRKTQNSPHMSAGRPAKNEDRSLWKTDPHTPKCEDQPPKSDLLFGSFVMIVAAVKRN
jgi:hypothetical protein